jgi:hypothetical protein
MKEETTTEGTIETAEGTRITEETRAQRETIGIIEIGTQIEEVRVRIGSQIIDGVIGILITDEMIAETEEMNGNSIRKMIGGEILGMTQITEREVMWKEPQAMI